MNLLFSCVGRRGYFAQYFRPHLSPGDRIIGTSNTPWTPGLASCDLGVLMPDIRQPAYIPSLLSLCRKERVDALLSFFDPDVDKLARHREEFRDIGILPILPSPEVSEIGLDKYRTPQFLTDHGFDSLATFATLPDARAALDAGQLNFPVMVKPRWGFGSHNQFLANDVLELNVFFDYAPKMVVQQFHPGQEYHLDVFTDLGGNVVAVVPKMKSSMRAGETDRAITVEDPGLIALGTRFGEVLGELGHVGPLDVDVFASGSQTYILEFNPRFGGGYPLSHLAGADFPGMVVAMTRGEMIEPRIGQYVRGVFMMKEYSVLGGLEQAHLGGLIDHRGQD